MRKLIIAATLIGQTAAASDGFKAYCEHVDAGLLNQVELLREADGMLRQLLVPETRAGRQDGDEALRQALEIKDSATESAERLAENYAQVCAPHFMPRRSN